MTATTRATARPPLGGIDANCNRNAAAATKQRKAPIEAASACPTGGDEPDWLKEAAKAAGLVEEGMAAGTKQGPPANASTPTWLKRAGAKQTAAQKKASEANFLRAKVQAKKKADEEKAAKQAVKKAQDAQQAAKKAQEVQKAGTQAAQAAQRQAQEAQKKARAKAPPAAAAP